jgi:hypothetical protein
MRPWLANINYGNLKFHLNEETQPGSEIKEDEVGSMSVRKSVLTSFQVVPDGIQFIYLG